MARSAEGLKASIKEIQALQKEFWSDVKIPGEIDNLNPELEKAGRVADFLELGELMCIDALICRDANSFHEPCGSDCLCVRMYFFRISLVTWFLQCFPIHWLESP